MKRTLFVCTLILLSGFAQAAQPTFSISPQPTVGPAPFTVDFSVCDLTPNSAGAKFASVEFGDGQRSVGQCRVTHTYNSAGIFQAVLRYKSKSQAFSVQVLESTLKPSVELSASPNPVSGIEPSTIAIKLTDPYGEPMTWVGTLSVTPPYSGGSLTPSSGGPVASGGTDQAVYQTPGGLAVGTVTITATDTRGLSNSASISIPTCQPTGSVSYTPPSSSGGLTYIPLPLGSTLDFTVDLTDCPNVAATVSATANNPVTLNPADGTVVGQGQVIVTFHANVLGNDELTITAKDALGFQNLLLSQPIVVQ